MKNIPSGSVTFLFTGIEGSIKLSQEFPETYSEMLARHDEVLQNAVESNRGFVFKTAGEGFCCAFQNAEDAVTAAIDAQLNLHSENRDEMEIKIRIGIHSGKSEWNGTDYMGYMTLARSARIMSAANEEQIIISNDAYELCCEKFNNVKSKNVTFRDLGERRLKDVIQPIRLFQIISPGLREEFPPLKTLDARPNNLPVQLSSFIGREEEMKQIKELLKQSRLLTIFGSGGAGKTRLAMQTGADMIDEFANGVFITELAEVSEPGLIIQTLMNSLGLKEEPGILPKEILTGYLKNLEILIIFDNCEHLVNECAELVTFLLRSCPGLKIITTSRESLNCPGEQTFRAPSLSLPDKSEFNIPEKLAQCEAVRLFTERALSVNPEFRITGENAQALAEICIRLDGIPLAIELAAARIKILTLQKICDRLDDRFKLLSGGKRTSLPRQQTLKALIDWSYDLLTENEKLLWRRLSVFTGGWTLESAEEIFSDSNISEEEIIDLLSQLADKSVIIYNSETNRYLMLESLKQYGAEKLKDAGEEKKYRSKHLNYFTEFSREAELKLKGNELHIWLDKLESDHGNLQSAISWAAGEGDKEEGAQLAGQLAGFWEIHGHNTTGILLLESILESIKGNEQNISKKSSAKVLMSIGILARNLGNFEKSKTCLKESLEISRGTGDKQSVAGSLINLGIVESDQGFYNNALKLYEESLDLGREINDKRSIADSLINMGTAAYHLGNFKLAQDYLEESLSLRRDTGYKQGTAMCLNNLGSLALRQGNLEKGVKLYSESLAIAREIGDKTGIAMGLNNLAGLSSVQENYELAQSYLEESLSLFRGIGDRLGTVMILNNLGMLECSYKNYDKAIELFSGSIKLSREIGDNIGTIDSLIGFSAALNNENHFSLQVKLLGAVDSALQNLGLKLHAKYSKFHENISKQLRDKLSDEEFSKYFEEGKKLSLEEASKLSITQTELRY